MSIEIVNGYICRNCSDVALAKKGEDPQGKPSSLVAADHGGKAGKIGGFGDDEERGVNKPLASGERGTHLNILS